MVLGVATAVSVLSGALLVGDSVRGSLHDLILKRIGQTDYVISSSGYFGESLSVRLKQHPSFTTAFGDACPMIVKEGIATHQENRRRVNDVRIYGINAEFWSFNLLNRSPGEVNGRNVLIGSGLANELGAKRGDSILLRLEAPDEIPLEYLQGRKEKLGKTLRVQVSDILSNDQLGSFALRPTQGVVHTVFISLSFLQHELECERQANTILISENPVSSGTLGADFSTHEQNLQVALRERANLDDLALRLRLNEDRGYFTLESASTLLTESQAAMAQSLAASAGILASPLFTYLANSIDHDSRRVPYSLVSGLAKPLFDELQANCNQQAKPYTQAAGSPPGVPVERRNSAGTLPLPPIILNNWTAEDLGSSPGDTITLEYFVWEENGLLATKTTDFCLQAIVPIRELAADRDLAPEYPGISDSENLSDWDPPFPLDLRRIRPKDEEYWKKFKTTPKGFIPLEIAQQLWKSRFGAFTSVRFYPPETMSHSSVGYPVRPLNLANLADHFAGKLTPLVTQNLSTFSIWPLRQDGVRASEGATDFGAYFTYFSFFLVLSAVALAGLFFRFGLEQRIREIGILRSLGFSISAIKRVFLIEGIVISTLGGMLGIIGAWGFSQVVVHGLKTWWIGAVHTKELSVHITSFPLWIGFVSGGASASLVILFSLRMLGASSPRTLLSGGWFTFPPFSPQGATEKDLLASAFKNGTYISAHSQWRYFLPAFIFTLIGLLLLIASRTGIMSQTLGFFSAGMAFLIAVLSAIYCWLRHVRGKGLAPHPPWALAALGLRNLRHRPARSLFSIALIAVATFIIVSVDAFRQVDHGSSIDKKSGTGGFPLQAESLLPIVFNLNQAASRRALNLEVLNTPEFGRTRIDRFRVRPGDDTSCLNLYLPRNPRILAPTSDFLAENRFTFHSSLASSPEEIANPWLLLTRAFDAEVIPAIVDRNSLNYTLHLKLGDVLILNRADGSKIRLRIMGVLADSLFQSEMLISETNFLKLFPQEQGYRFFLIDPPRAELSPLIETLEERLSQYGFDVSYTSDRLAHFHQVENTYLSTFQSLGGLGLLLGSFGLVAVLLRNIVESRRQLGLLRAVGYTSRHLITMVSSENIILLSLGLAAGTLCALVAIIPAILERGGQFPSYSFAWLVPSILVTGAISSLFAASSVLRISLVTVLKSE